MGRVKRCSKCRKEPRRYGPWCRTCTYAYNREWCRRNPEKVRAQAIRQNAKPETREYRAAYARRPEQRAKRKEYSRERWTQPEIRRRERDRQLRQKYGISEQDFVALAAQQRGVCAICASSDRLAVDHDHVTGKVRGLLCRKCNWAIGNFDDSPEILAEALRYLKDPHG